jgi:predicted nucleic acid-binding protein
MTTSEPGPPPHAAELDIQQLVGTLHRRTHVAPIAYADSAGAFPATVLLPRVFPLVLDANMIRGELIRMGGSGRTVLVNAANSGVFRLFVAEHVVDEVWEHYATWARRRKVAAADVRAAWESGLLPLLRCVTVPDAWATVDESARLARLARPAPGGDPDDVPTATLALLLGAPLLSRDGKPLEAVYGPGFDKETHIEWLNALRAGGDLGPLGQYLQLSTNLIVLLGKGVIGGLRAAAGRWSWSAALLAIAGCGAVVSLLAPADLRKRIGSGIGTVLEVSLTFMAGVTAAHQRAEEQFRTLAAPSPSDERILADLAPQASIGRLCLRELARAPESHLSAAELHDRLTATYTIPGGAQTVQRTLDHWACFEHVGDGEYQVGRALVLGLDPGDELDTTSTDALYVE